MDANIYDCFFGIGDLSNTHEETKNQNQKSDQKTMNFRNQQEPAIHRGLVGTGPTSNS
jgi:hypothetical protein